MSFDNVCNIIICQKRQTVKPLDHQIIIEFIWRTFKILVNAELLTCTTTRVCCTANPSKQVKHNMNRLFSPVIMLVVTVVVVAECPIDCVM